MTADHAKFQAVAVPNPFMTDTAPEAPAAPVHNKSSNGLNMNLIIQSLANTG